MHALDLRQQHTGLGSSLQHTGVSTSFFSCFVVQNYTADAINYSVPLSKDDFEAAMKKYDISKPKKP